MKKYALLLFLPLLFQFCEKDPVSDKNAEQMGTVSLSIDLVSAPEEVAGIEGELTRSGYDTIGIIFEIVDDTAMAVVEDIPHGQWTLSVRAMNDTDLVLYSGKTTVEVIPGIIKPVSLHLDPTTGGLVITVTWGAEDDLKSSMIFMAKNEFDEWRIMSMNLDGSNLYDITGGRYPVWMNDKNSFIYRLDTYTLAEFNLLSNDYQVIGTTPYVVNFLRYSRYKNRIVCDFKDSVNWHIAHMNLDISDFTKVIVDDSWKKRPVPLPMQDWIYYQGNVSGNIQLYRIKYNGQDNEPVTVLGSEGEASFPSFNKGGTKLLYSAKGNNYFYIIERDLASGNENVFDFSDEGEAIYPVYSPDDKYIIYILVTGPAYEDREIYRMNSDGSNRVNITPDGSYYHFAHPSVICR